MPRFSIFSGFGPYAPLFHEQVVWGLVLLGAGALHHLGAVGGAQIVEEFHFLRSKIIKI